MSENFMRAYGEGLDLINTFFFNKIIPTSPRITPAMGNPGTEPKASTGAVNWITKLDPFASTHSSPLRKLGLTIILMGTATLYVAMLSL